MNYFKDFASAGIGNNNRKKNITNSSHFVTGKYGFMLFLFCSVTFLQVSCKKFVDVAPPVTSLTSANVYSSDATAASVLTGIYTNFSSSNLSGGFALPSTSLFLGLSSDELTLYEQSNTQYLYYYQNALTSVNTDQSGFWYYVYPTIYVANAAIEGVNASNSLTPAVKQQLLGEANFVRAFCYFYLVNLYGDVPLVTSTNYEINAGLARTPKAQVWQQIIADLKTAQGLLSANFLDATLLNTSSERTRPSKWAATALLARAYLYSGDFKDAETQASAVINNSSQFTLDSLNGVFLKNSNEAIWQLQPVSTGENTQDALLFVLPSSGPGGNWPVYLSNSLLSSFENGDQRKAKWVNSVADSVNGTSVIYYYAFKYKVNLPNSPVTEYEMVLRLAEQYLIRAEAEASGFGSGVSGAVNDLNVIRNRAGLPNYSGPTDKTSLMNAILHEREVEFFTEWGHRWLDLKRTGTINSIMQVDCGLKGGTWNTDSQYFPIPLTELKDDPNLQQNPGY